jgi:hypothetical protein
MDPVERLAIATREARFGEHGGVNPSIEVSTTFTGQWGNREMLRAWMLPVLPQALACCCLKGTDLIFTALLDGLACQCLGLEAAVAAPLLCSTSDVGGKGREPC